MKPIQGFFLLLACCLPYLNIQAYRTSNSPNEYVEKILVERPDLVQINQTGTLLLTLMEKAQTIEEIDGQQKKEWVLRAFRAIVYARELSVEQRGMLLCSAPNLIDTLKAASKHQTDEFIMPNSATDIPGAQCEQACNQLILDQIHSLYVSFKTNIHNYDVAALVATTFDMVEKLTELNENERKKIQVCLVQELLRRTFPDYLNVESFDHVAFCVLSELTESSIQAYRIAFSGLSSLQGFVESSIFSYLEQLCETWF